MITKQLIDPSSIVIVGGSNDITKPGGKVLKNLMKINHKIEDPLDFEKIRKYGRT